MSATFTSFIAVGLGAAIGAWSRWGLTLWLNARHPQFPLGTFISNAIGGFLIGVAIAYLANHPELSPTWRLLIVTGFLGGLTTFSTYSAEVIALIERGQIAWALGVVSAHLATSLSLTIFGLWVGRNIFS